jgi:hypothetical protein
LHQFVFEARDTAGPFWPVYLRNVSASDQFGPIALRFQALRQCLNVGLQVRGILFGRDVVDPTGSGLVQVIPAGAEQGRIQAPLQLPKPVLLVSSCFVGYPPQGGWLLGLRSDRVRQKFPVRATYFRHVLPPAVGFPHLRVLGVIRLPRGMQRAFPLTVLLRLPGTGAAAARRFQHCAVAGLPLPCLRSCIPYAGACAVQEPLGPPKFFTTSLPACRGLRTPADRPLLAHAERLVLPAGAFKPSASATSAFSKLYQHFRVRGYPYGLQDTLSTLRPSCSPCPHGSAMDARLATGGWLALTRQGLAPCKRCQAFLGARTLALSRAWKRERSGRWRQSASG